MMVNSGSAALVDIVSAPNLAGREGITHAFFTRRGGASGGIYTGLNCGQGSDDDVELVMENRARAMAALGMSADALALVHQVHSPTVWRVDRPRGRADMVKADALVSDHPGLALGILTADCAPVLFADAAHGVVGAAHAGWRGALAGVLENTVAETERLGAARSSIRAALGPCIRQPSYEVGGDLRYAFLAERPGSEPYFAAGARPDHYQFDLGGFIMDSLSRLNLGDIADTGHDTYPDEDRFFSYRRATHRGEPDYGRGLAVVALTKE